MAISKAEQSKTCFWCLKAIKWIPVLFILTIVVWSYYAYVIQLCLMTVDSTLGQVLYLTFYHAFFFMFFWAYLQTIFTDIGRVPSNFRINDIDFEAYMHHGDSTDTQNRILTNCAKNLPVYNVTVGGNIRFCEKCKSVKPDRTHHCSVCGECVLKMDHHCPWINNCVCFTNYKYFVLFLGYALLYCLYVSLTALPYFISFWKGNLQGVGRFHILFLFFVAIMFGISLMSLFGYHCYLVLENRTTLEAFRAPSFRGVGPDKYGFHLGRYKNFKEVFGENPKLWFFPIQSSLGDGIQYPLHSRQLQSSYHTMDTVETSLGNGIVYPQRHIDEDHEGLLREHPLEEDESMQYP